MDNITQSEPTHIIRPLNILIPLIKEKLKEGDQAADEASTPYYQAAGEMMLEAKGQMPHGDFAPWLQRHFKRSSTTTSKYMRLAKTMRTEIYRGRQFSSLNAFHKATKDPAYMPNKPRPQPWHEPVKQALGGVNVETLKQDALKRLEERALQRKLALSLIDIGYKALATKLHPDKGGSAEAMTRLNRVRKLLQQAVSS
jgi:hypothetical protein